MKKTATLVAGLLLVTGTVLAGGVFAEGWNLTGSTVEGNLWLMHSANGPLTTDGEDLNIELKANHESELGTFGVTATFDKEDEDREVTLSYSRVQGRFEVGLGATVLEQKNDDDATFRMQTKEGSDSYLKWNVTDKMSLTYYPWEVADMSWDNETWESFNFDQLIKGYDANDDIILGDGNQGGVALGMKVNEGTTATFKLAIIDGNGDTPENFYAFKAELSTKLSNGKLDAYVGMATTDDENMMALGALANMNLSETLNLLAELNYQDQDYPDAAIGAYVKGTVKLNDIAEYKASAYASFKYLNKSAFVLDEEDIDANYEDFMEIEAGLTLAQGNFSVTPKIVIGMQDGGFEEYKEETATEDMAYKFGVNFKYAL